MRFRKKMLIFILTSLILIITINILDLNIISTTRCNFIEYSSDFVKINSNVYISNKNTTDIEKDSIKVMYDNAKLRNKNLFGAVKSNAIIIISKRYNLLKKLDVPNNTGAARNYPVGSTFVLLGPDGINIDVMAHEMVHAEIFDRVGWYKSSKNTGLVS